MIPIQFKTTSFKTTAISIGIAIIAILLFLQQCNHSRVLNNKLIVAEQNVKAGKDSLRIVKDSEGNIEINKLAYLTDRISNLEKLNNDLYNEIKTVKGKVTTIIKSDIKIIHDTLTLVSEGKVNDSIVIVTFKYDTTYDSWNYRKLSGYTGYNLLTKKSVAELTEDEIGIGLVTGIKNLDKGKPEIFFKSNYPNFIITSLEGAVLDPKLFTKRPTRLITTGINIGWTPTTYNFKTKSFDFVPGRIGITAGVNINIVKLLKRRQ